MRHYFATTGFAIAALAIALASPAFAQSQVGAVANANANANSGALAGVNFTPNSFSNVTYPRQVPSQALGSFGGGANSCAEGGGFNLGTGGFGVGFDQATSNQQCNDRQSAALFFQFAKAFGDPRAAVAGLLTQCASTPKILAYCKSAGLWVAPASTPPIPPALMAGYYPQQPAVQPAIAPQPVAAPAPMPVAPAKRNCAGMTGADFYSCTYNQ